MPYVDDATLLNKWEALLGKSIRSRYGNDFKKAAKGYYEESPLAMNGEKLRLATHGPLPGLGGYRLGRVRLDPARIAEEAAYFGNDPQDTKLGTFAHEVGHAEDRARGFRPTEQQRMFSGTPEGEPVVQRHFLNDQISEDVPWEGRKSIWLMLKQLQDAGSNPKFNYDSALNPAISNLE